MLPIDVQFCFMFILHQQASKAALVSLYETLRVEVGSDIGITIVTPGYIESELTKGKFLTAEGKVDVEQDMRDVSKSSDLINLDFFNFFSSSYMPHIFTISSLH